MRRHSAIAPARSGSGTCRSCARQADQPLAERLQGLGLALARGLAQAFGLRVAGVGEIVGTVHQGAISTPVPVGVRRPVVGIRTRPVSRPGEEAEKRGAMVARRGAPCRPRACQQISRLRSTTGSRTDCHAAARAGWRPCPSDVQERSPCRIPSSAQPVRPCPPRRRRPCPSAPNSTGWSG